MNFSNFYHLIRHHKAIHQKNRLPCHFYCTECWELLSTKEEAKEHIRQKHNPNAKAIELEIELPKHQFSQMVNSAISYIDLNFEDIRDLLSLGNAPLLMENPKKTSINDLKDSTSLSPVYYKTFERFKKLQRTDLMPLTGSVDDFYFYDSINFEHQYENFPKFHIIKRFFIYSKIKEKQVKKISNFGISFVCPLHHVVTFPCFIAVTCLVGQAQIHLRKIPFGSAVDVIINHQSKLKEEQPKETSPT